jgi:hypothetical protein
MQNVKINLRLELRSREMQNDRLKFKNNSKQNSKSSAKGGQTNSKLQIIFKFQITNKIH